MENNRALIVDDAYFMRTLIKRTLKEAGYEVVGEAKNGIEGVKMYFDLKPDFVTMDINMPDKTGIEATREILSKDPKAKIIAVTANDDEQVKAEMIAAGALAYLKKPFQPAFLLTRIEDIFSQPASSIVEPAYTTIAEAADYEDDNPFEHKEIELLNESDNDRDRSLVIENDEDRYSIPDSGDDKEKYELTDAASTERYELEKKNETTVDGSTIAETREEPVALVDSIAHPIVLPANPPTSLIAKEPETMAHEPELPAPELSTASLVEHRPIVEQLPDSMDVKTPPFPPTPPSSYLQIRPPRGRENEAADGSVEELGDLILHNDEDGQDASSKKKGFLSFITNLFKTK